MRDYLGIFKAPLTRYLTTPITLPNDGHDTLLQAVIKSTIAFSKANIEPTPPKVPFIFFVLGSLIEAKHDPHMQDICGRTPLYYAVKYNQLELVRYFIDSLQADVLTHDYKYKTLLHIAPDKPMVGFLLERGAKISKNDRGNTPLHMWVKRGYSEKNIEIINALLEADPSSLDVANDQGDTLLHVARGEMIPFLLEKGIKIEPNYRGTTPLHHAVKRNDVMGVKALVESEKCDVNALDRKANTPLHFAQGKTEEGQMIIEYLTSDSRSSQSWHMTNSQHLRPFQQFLLKGDIGAAQYKLTLNKKRSTIESHLLHTVTSGGNLSKKSTQSLRSSKPDSEPNENNEVQPSYVEYTVFRVIMERLMKWQTSFYENMTLVEMTIDLLQALIQQNKQCLNEVDGWERTPLYIAVLYNQIDMVKYLIKMGADLTIADKKGNTVFHVAQGKSMTQILLDTLHPRMENSHKCLVLPLNQAGQSPLHTACIKGDLEKLGYLLINLNRIQIDINLPDAEGYTPLTTAIRHDHKPLVKLLQLILNSDPQTLVGVNGPIVIIKHFMKLKPKDCSSGTLSKIIIKLFDTVIQDNQYNLNAVDSLGRTPLYLAVLYNQVDVVHYLIQAGADITIADREGNTVFHIAEEEHMTYVLIAALHSKVGNANKRLKLSLNQAGQSPLHTACIKGDVLKVGYLLMSAELIQIDIHLPDAQGNTPLKLAAYHHNSLLNDILQLALAGRAGELKRQNGPLHQYFQSRRATKVDTPRQESTAFVYPSDHFHSDTDGGSYRARMLARDGYEYVPRVSHFRP